MDGMYRFQRYMQETLAITKGDKIILAVSGGRDSMFMAHLFRRAGYPSVVAHCNFHLRGAEADLDEQLVREYAADNKLPCYVQHFQTETYAKKRGISTQMAARELRYTWFEELRAQQGAKWIAIAQHQDDHIETVLLNLTRGTGLQGLQGILPKRGHLIRPLLFFSSKEITDYVLALGIPFRDDQSNFSTQYTRNKIRLEIIPKFREINPQFDATIRENIIHFQEANALLQSFVAPIREKLFVRKGALIQIQKAAMEPYLSQLSMLYELFKPYGFSKNVLSDIREHWNGDSGKIFHAPEYELLLDRDAAFMKSRGTVEKIVEEMVIPVDCSEFAFAGREFEATVGADKTIRPWENILQVDFEKLCFPLKLRFWEEGDSFYPLGMAGRQKKLSDYFIQQKIGRYEKANVPILINGNGDIVWLVNHRADNRYRITESTKKVFTLVCK